MTPEEHKEYLRLEELRIKETIRNIKHRIVVFSGKGGVGKTTVSVNLAYSIMKKNNRTGLLDADVTGPNVAKMAGMNYIERTEDGQILPWSNENLKIISLASMLEDGQPVIWRGPMRSKLINSFLADVRWGELDYLIADLPPGTGDEILTITEDMEPELAIIVTTPQEVSLIDSLRAINLAKTLKVPKIALIENMSGLICPECGKTIYPFGKDGGKLQAIKNDIEFLGSLPLDPNARELADNGIPFIIEKSNSKISKNMNVISDNIISLIEK